MVKEALSSLLTPCGRIEPAASSKESRRDCESLDGAVWADGGDLCHIYTWVKGFRVHVWVRVRVEVTDRF